MENRLNNQANTENKGYQPQNISKGLQPKPTVSISNPPKGGSNIKPGK